MLTPTAIYWPISQHVVPRQQWQFTKTWHSIDPVVPTLGQPGDNQLWYPGSNEILHYSDVIMSTIASQITSLAIVYSTVYSDADQREHQSSASLAFVRGIHRWPVNSPHKWPVTRKILPFDDVIMLVRRHRCVWNCEPGMDSRNNYSRFCDD